MHNKYKLIAIFILFLITSVNIVEASDVFWITTSNKQVTEGYYETQDACNQQVSTINNSDASKASGYLSYCDHGTFIQYNTAVANSKKAVSFDPSQTPTDTGSDYKLLAPIGGSPTIKTNDIGNYFNILFTTAIGLCGALAVIMIVIGSIQYMGDESIFGKTEAKGKIFSAIFGLIIALGAFALLNTIDPSLTGKNGLNVAQVTATIVNLPDAGDSTVDPGFKTKDWRYTTDSSISSSMPTIVNKLKSGWQISSFKVYQNKRMLVSLTNGSTQDNSNLIDIENGLNGFAPAGTAKPNDKKSPVGNWTILEVRTAPNNQPVYNATGSNMGASFWLLSPMSNGERGIGMHGNKNGTLSATNGCIRLKNSDILALLPYVKAGIPVIISN